MPRWQYALQAEVSRIQRNTRLPARTPRAQAKLGSFLTRKEEPSLACALGVLAGNRVFLWILLTSACNAYCHLGIVQWLPSYFARTQHLSLAVIGTAFGSTFGLGLGLGG